MNVICSFGLFFIFYAVKFGMSYGLRQLLCFACLFASHFFLLFYNDEEVDKLASVLSLQFYVIFCLVFSLSYSFRGVFVFFSQFNTHFQTFLLWLCVYAAVRVFAKLFFDLGFCSPSSFTWLFVLIGWFIQHVWLSWYLSFVVHTFTRPITNVLQYIECWTIFRSLQQQKKKTDSFIEFRLTFWQSLSHAAHWTPMNEQQKKEDREENKNYAGGRNHGKVMIQI